MNVGIDIVAIERFRSNPYGKESGFYKKAFTEREIQYCLSKADPPVHFAGVFAAKEATAKALRKNSVFKIRTLEILHDAAGAPYVESGDSGIKTSLSISHDQTHAVAVCIAYSSHTNG